MSPRLRGASAATVRAALKRGDPLPGTRGFAGRLAVDADGVADVDGGADDGADDFIDTQAAVVRDVLGRQPVFTQAGDPTRWSFDPTGLGEPRAVPAGHLRTASGDERRWRLPDPEPVEDADAAVERVRRAVQQSHSAVDTAGLAVAFSGGIDSAAVAAGLCGDGGGDGSDDETGDGTTGRGTGVDGTVPPLYVVGFEGSHDVAAARSGAGALDRSVTVVEVTHGDLERAVRAVVAATGRTNAMDVQIAATLYLVAERAAADGYDRLAVGQGADELFGGYAKVANAPEDSRVAADTVRGARREVVGTLPDQLERDVLTMRHAGVEPVAPLLDDRVVRAALALPEELLVADGQRKVALRRAVRSWVPDAVADRDKKALQYGSLVARELDRLARQAGFKRRLNDHVSRYVESLADSRDGSAGRR